MSIYKDLEKIKAVAMHYSKEHCCSYNIIMMNPDENGEFQECSTYEYVADSYFQKERTCKLITTTNQIWEDEGSPFQWINKGDYDAATGDGNYEFLEYKQASHAEAIRRERPQQYRRESPKIGRNSKCPCESGKKHKHCCLK